MRLKEVVLERYRGWQGPTSWSPGAKAVLLGPNNGGKSSLLRAVDIVLNPHRNPYRDLFARHDFFDLKTDEPIRFTVVLEDLSPEDCDVFEPFLEGQRDDGSFGPADSPEEEFDQGSLVLRLELSALLEEPAAAVFARPDAGAPRVSQEQKLRIGWYLVPADLDPLKELAFYSNSIFAKLFEQVDLGSELDAIRQGIENAKGDLMKQKHVSETRERLEAATRKLGLVDGADPLDFAVLDLSDRRVLQSLQLVLRGARSDHRLPLRSHGRGVLRALLLAAVLQHARMREDNLILAVEEPEQNLEPINQRLIARSLLFAADNGTAQTIVSTHSPAIASALPLSSIELVRDKEGCPAVRSLSQVQPAEHKFYERHARGAVIDGLYASAVLLVEGPTDTGALLALWAKAFPQDGLDERRIEIIDCESIDKVGPFVRFFSALDIPVAVICDCDPGAAQKRQDILDAGAGLLIHWQSHTDIEGVLAAESDVGLLAAAMEEIRAEVGPWDKHRSSLIAAAKSSAGDHAVLKTATDIPGLIEGYEESGQREALCSILRGSLPSFKSSRDQRLICEALESTPPTAVSAMKKVHAFVDEGTGGEHAL
jgi:putative ATP-dependent endonuclease of the OLD family